MTSDKLRHEWRAHVMRVTHGARLLPVVPRQPAWRGRTRSAALQSPLAGPLDPGQAAELAAVFKALADPVRLRLLSLIHRCGTDGARIADLAPQVGLTQPTTSHHMALLRGAGFVRPVRERGRWHVHHVAYDELAAVAGLLRPARRKP